VMIVLAASGQSGGDPFSYTGRRIRGEVGFGAGRVPGSHPDAGTVGSGSGQGLSGVMRVLFNAVRTEPYFPKLARTLNLRVWGGHDRRGEVACQAANGLSGHGRRMENPAD
jgi:hypothetical protein